MASKKDLIEKLVNNGVKPSWKKHLEAFKDGKITLKQLEEKCKQKRGMFMLFKRKCLLFGPCPYKKEGNCTATKKQYKKCKNLIKVQEELNGYKRNKMS